MTSRIRNAYDIRLRNKQGEDARFRITVDSQEPVRMQLEGETGNTITVAADKLKTQRLYVIAPKGASMAHAERSEITIWIEDIASNVRVSESAVFNGDGR